MEFATLGTLPKATYSLTKHKHMPSQPLLCPNSQKVHHKENTRYTIKQILNEVDSKPIDVVCCSECSYILGLIDPDFKENQKALKEISNNVQNLYDALLTQNGFLETISKKTVEQSLSVSDIDRIASKLSTNKVFLKNYDDYVLVTKNKG